MYRDPFQLVLVFGQYSSQLMMSSHDLCMPSLPWGTAALNTSNEVAVWLQMLHPKAHQQSLLFENLTSIPFCSTSIRSITKHNL